MSNDIGSVGGTKPPLPTVSDSVTGGGPLAGAPAETAPQSTPEATPDTTSGTDAGAGAGAVTGGGPMEFMAGITNSPWTGPVMAAAGIALLAFTRNKTVLQNGAEVLKKGSRFGKISGYGMLGGGLLLTGQNASKFLPAQPGATAPGANTGGTVNSGTGETVPNDAQAAYQQGVQYGALTVKAEVEKAIADGRLIDATAGGGAQPGGTPTPTPGSGGQTPVTDPAAQTPQIDPATGQPVVNPNTPAVDPATGQPVADTPAAEGSTGTAAPVPAGQWTPGALLGQAVSTEEGRSATGSVVAEPGKFILTSVMGDPNGYATFDEANAAARSGMSTEVMGTKKHRWLVIEHGGRFFAFDAQLDESKSAPAPAMPAGNGTVVGWNALRYVDETWTSYQHRTGQAPVAAPFADGQAAVSGSTSTTSSGTTPGATPAPGVQPTAPIPGQQAQPLTGGGPLGAGGGVEASPVAALVGRGFAINASSVDGTKIAGGYLQIQSVPDLGQGLATPAEAAQVIRDLKRGKLSPTAWQRWVTVKASDGRYYVLEGSIVNKPVPAFEGGAAPMHVFGHGFAEHFDGTAWKASRDVA